MSEPNLEALAHPWMTGFDAMFDEVYFNETTDYKIARDSIGIFTCSDGEWMEAHPELSSCGYSHDFIEKHVFGLDHLERFKLVDPAQRCPEAAYMRGAFAAAKVLDLQNI
ncbi:MAG: hypothetical protein JWS12_737 [Candidatus Saccharibacteria bacterium]|nr:hypothetical protein [Candidatus Saccharibacteria bacterium]